MCYIIQLVLLKLLQIVIGLPQDLNGTPACFLSIAVKIDSFFHEIARRTGFDQRERLLPEAFAVCPFGQIDKGDLILFQQSTVSNRVTTESGAMNDPSYSIREEVTTLNVFTPAITLRYVLGF